MSLKGSTPRRQTQAKRSGAPHFPSIPEALEPDPEAGALETAPGVEDWKQKVTAELASTVSEQALDKLKKAWAPNMDEMKKMHKMHTYKVDAMQAQVNWFLESNKRLVEENRQLRCSVEHLIHYLGAMCHGKKLEDPQTAQSMQPGSPQLKTPPPLAFPTLAESPIKVSEAAPLLPAWMTAELNGTADTTCELDKQNSSSGPISPAASLLTKTGQTASDTNSQLNQSHIEAPASSFAPNSRSSDSDSSSGQLNSPPPGLVKVGSSSDLSTVASSALIFSYTITLRRVEGSPLGLEVTKPEADDKFLVIERVLPFSVAESWNKQNSGGKREILQGDRVVSVNGACEPQSMRVEFRTKPLLKVIFERTEVLSSNLRGCGALSSSGSRSSTPEQVSA